MYSFLDKTTGAADKRRWRAKRHGVRNALPLWAEAGSFAHPPITPPLRHGGFFRKKGLTKIRNYGLIARVRDVGMRRRRIRVDGGGDGGERWSRNENEDGGWRMEDRKERKRGGSPRMDEVGLRGGERPKRIAPILG